MALIVAWIEPIGLRGAPEVVLERGEIVYQKSLDTWHRVPHPNHTSPSSFQAGDPIVVAKELKQTETALAGLH